MHKKGQVTVFVIIGIVLVILAVLIWYLVGSDKIRTPNVFLGFDGKKEGIDNNLRSCVEKAVVPVLNLSALQGGKLNPRFYRAYKGYKVSYLCWVIPGQKKCYNIMPTLSAIESENQKVIQQLVNKCVDKSLLDGIETEGTKNINVKLSILRDSVIVDINYDVTLINNNGIRFPIENKKIVLSNMPYGELYNVVRNIVNSEATYGDFEPLFFMLGNKGKYEINVDRPFPDKIYIINKKDSDFKFQIAIEGANRLA